MNRDIPFASFAFKKEFSEEAYKYNMKIKFRLFLLLLIPFKLFGTAQIPDLLIYKGDTLALFSCPLSFYPDNKLINPESLFGSKGCFYTACWRNYVATWKLLTKSCI